MNILDIELEYSRVFNIIPNAYITLGKSIWLRFSWLNFELAIKHISCDYKAKCLRLHTPSATLNSYPNSGYSATLEICAFGYVYRKGLLEQSWSFSTAVNFFNSVINLMFLIATNTISKKLSDTSLW